MSCVFGDVKEILLFTLHPLGPLDLFTSMDYFHEKIVFLCVLCRKFLENEQGLSPSGVIIVKPQNRFCSFKACLITETNPLSEARSSFLS